MVGFLANRWINPLYHHLTNDYGRVAGLFGRAFPMNPLVLRLRVTQNCNLRCGFCYQEGFHTKHESGHLSLDEWRRVLSKLPRWTIIDITGGEPFLAPGFPKLLELILGMGFKTSLITNGSLCSEDDLKRAVEGKLAYFMVSVDGLEDYHNHARGSRQSFAKLRRTLETIRELKQRTGARYPVTCLKTTLTGDNYDQLVPLHELAIRELGVENHSLNLLFQNPVRGGARLARELDDGAFAGNRASYPKVAIPHIVREVERLFAVARKNGVEIRFKPDIALSELPAYLANPGSFGVRSCHKIRSVMTLYYDGTTTPCDIGVATGNIRDYGYDIKRVMAGEPLGRVSSAVSARGSYPGSCDGCCLMPHTRRAT